MSERSPNVAKAPPPHGRTSLRHAIDLAVTIVPLLLIALVYGHVAHDRQWFPSNFIDQAKLGYHATMESLGFELPWYMAHVGDAPRVKSYQPDKIAPGLTLLSGLGTANHSEARIIDRNGTVINAWDLDWFKIWPDQSHLPLTKRYQGLPGPLPHGMVIEPNGDLIFNYEDAGIVRVNACGDVRWRLPIFAHHSVFQDEDGNVWTPAVTWMTGTDPTLPGYAGEWKDYYIAKVSPDGKLLQTWRVFDLLRRNGLEAYAYMGSADNFWAGGVYDSLHLNNIDIFPRSMKPGTFKPGDIMISLRNINAILVFDPATLKVRHMFVGPFIRQHDPDFIDGNTIRVFDNQTNTNSTVGEHSRILELYTDGRSPRTLFEGNAQHPFFSLIMGKQEAQANGNILLTEAMRGRALEIDAQGNPVWEYRNFYKPGVSTVLTGAYRLDPAMDAAFFARARAACATGKGKVAQARP